MSFIAILLALLLEQVRPLARTNPIHEMLRGWVAWVARNFDAGRRHHAALACSIAVVVPSVAVLGVHWLLAEFAGWPLVVVWHVVVLYITLGFRQFSHHFTAIRNALEQGDEGRARELLALWQQKQAGDLLRREIVRQVIEHSVIAAHRHVFGVLAWYSVMAAIGLGPSGAVFYRLCEFVPRYWTRPSLTATQPVSATLQNAASRLWSVVDWMPARMTAIGFAVVGSFEEAIESWRNYAQRGVGGSDGVILSATAGAINLRLGPGFEPQTVDYGAAQADAAVSADRPGQEPAPVHLSTVVGLVWRTVLMWMILLALLSLARLLG
ncbi:MAG: CobD/CbiB family protein [Rhodoferax sp.]|nr:CobD/CbiB family protein [Rhodoferax sp.]